MRAVEIFEGSDKPYIDAHRSGDIMWIDMMLVPPSQRGSGVGKAFYKSWEEALPSDIKLIRLLAADTGDGLSNGFWEAMGFEYQYDGDDLDYETSQYMSMVARPLSASEMAASSNPSAARRTTRCTLPSLTRYLLQRI